MTRRKTQGEIHVAILSQESYLAASAVAKEDELDLASAVEELVRVGFARRQAAKKSYAKRLKISHRRPK